MAGSHGSLILVATLGGPTMLARIGVMRALNRGKPVPAPMPRRKGAKAYRIVKHRMGSRTAHRRPY